MATPAMTQTTPSNTDPLLTRAQAAQYLTISVRHLSDLTGEGHVRPVKLGRSTRYRVSELERFLNDQTGATGVICRG